MMSVLSKSGTWWSSFRHKTQDISQTPIEPLTTFATRSFTSNNPTELGILVAAYARSSTQKNHLYALVDSLIISNSAFLATLNGMECLILLAKSYTDIGKPQRAWLLYRRGIATALVMVRDVSYAIAIEALLTLRLGAVQQTFRMSRPREDLVVFVSRGSLH
jgi:hypothetical protein